MSFYNSGITLLNNATSGYNILASSIVRPPLNINNFSDASSGYNIVVPAINIDNISTYKINGLDSSNTSLYIGPNTSVIEIGNINSSTYIYGKVTEINSQIVNIGLQNTILNLGNVSSQLVNISSANISTANILNANLSVANISVDNVLTANISLGNISVANISVLNAVSLNCNNASIVSSKMCYALWYSNIVNETNTYIGNGSPNILQTSVINNVSSFIRLPNNDYNGTFRCGYDGLYLCSVIVTPVVATTRTLIYLSKNQNCIGPIAYGYATNNTGNMITSISGSLTIYCNAGDILAFYNFGGDIQPGNNIKNENQLDIQTPATSAQLCSITIL